MVNYNSNDKKYNLPHYLFLLYSSKMKDIFELKQDINRIILGLSGKVK